MCSSDLDVNSGRATRERHIEETALKTNLEAAEEIGRQLRLRDLAGLIVIDFIDMEDGRRNREVERRLKESLRTDRARIQLGRISPFGLLEMSRQRMRPSLFESSTEVCPHCAGAGRVRTVESLALQVLRRLEEEGLRESDATIVVSVPTQVALYILNRKRDHLIAIEQRHDFRIAIEADDQLATDAFVIERDGVVAERRRTVQDEARDGDGEDGERKRGRRRRSRRRKDEEQPLAAEEQAGAAEAEEREPDDRQAVAEEQDGDRQRKRKRRGKRGGRNRSRRRGDAETISAADGSDEAVEAEADTGSEPEAATTDEAPEAAAEGSAADDRTAEAGLEEKSQEEKPKRRRSPRQRRGGRRSEAATDGEAASEDSAEAAAEAEERPQRASRRRGTGRGRGTRGGGRKSAGTEASEEGQSDTSAAAQPESPANGALGETPSEPFAPARTEPAQTDLPQTDTPPAAMVADDPKVVIEPANPAAAASAGEPTGATMQPSPEGDDKGDQPKRRGWWNRFI